MSDLDNFYRAANNDSTIDNMGSDMHYQPHIDPDGNITVGKTTWYKKLWGKLLIGLAVVLLGLVILANFIQPPSTKKPLEPTPNLVQNPPLPTAENKLEPVVGATQNNAAVTDTLALPKPQGTEASNTPAGATPASIPPAPNNAVQSESSQVQGVQSTQGATGVHNKAMPIAAQKTPIEPKPTHKLTPNTNATRASNNQDKPKSQETIAKQPKAADAPSNTAQKPQASKQEAHKSVKTETVAQDETQTATRLYASPKKTAPPVHKKAPSTSTALAGETLQQVTQPIGQNTKTMNNSTGVSVEILADKNAEKKNPFSNDAAVNAQGQNAVSAVTLKVLGATVSEQYSKAIVSLNNERKVVQVGDVVSQLGTVEKIVIQQQQALVFINGKAYN